MAQVDGSGTAASRRTGSSYRRNCIERDEGQRNGKASQYRWFEGSFQPSSMVESIRTERR
jgi:hypothetical protein